MLVLEKIVVGWPLATLLGTLARSAEREAAQPSRGSADAVASAAGSPVLAKPTLAELYDAYAQNVYRCLIGLGIRPSLAEDAMQDVFIIASRHLHTFEGEFYRAWLLKIASSVARNVRRSQRRAVTESLDSELLIDASSSPFDRAALSQQVALLNHLLEELSDRQREVFVLAELEQMPQVEIAQVLGVHVNTVANRLGAARAKLERLLRKHQSIDARGAKA